MLTSLQFVSNELHFVFQWQTVYEASLEITAWIVVACIVKFQASVIKLQDIASTAVNRDGVIPHVTQVCLFNSFNLNWAKWDFWSKPVRCPSSSSLLSFTFYIFIFFSRTTRPVSTNSTQNILGRRTFKFPQMKGLALFRSEIARIYWQI